MENERDLIGIESNLIEHKSGFIENGRGLIEIESILIEHGGILIDNEKRMWFKLEEIC